MSRVIGRGGLLAAAAMALCVSVPAQATMGCWNETQVAAAKVRDFQSRLMVATLRCRAMGIDISRAYNRFVIANRTTLEGANGVIRDQFRAGYGSDGEFQYDRFATSLANAYGGDDTDPWICSEVEDLAYEAADAQGNAHRLVSLAERIAATPRLPGGQCEVSFDRVDAEPVQVAELEQVETRPVLRDPWDEVESIPAPSAAVDESEATPPAHADEIEPAPVRVRRSGKWDVKTEILSRS